MRVLPRFTSAAWRPSSPLGKLRRQSQQRVTLGGGQHNGSHDLGFGRRGHRRHHRIHGGAVAEHIAKGEAELGIHQISEIIPVPGITLVGPLPGEIQNYTTYAAALSVGAKDNDVAKAFIKAFTGPGAAAVVKAKGMEQPGT